MKDNDYNVKAEYWRKVITQCNNRSSDISKAEWLDQHGIAHATYYKWQRLLRDDAIEQINDQKQLPELKAFVDITPVVQENTAETAAIPASVPQADTLCPEAMILINGYPVYVSSSLNPGTLETIVKILKNA